MSIDPRRLIASTRSTTGDGMMNAVGRRLAIAEDEQARAGRRSGFANRIADGSERGSGITYDPATHLITVAGEGYAGPIYTTGYNAMHFDGSAGDSMVAVPHGLGRVPTTALMSFRPGGFFYNMIPLGPINRDASNVWFAAQFVPGIGPYVGDLYFDWFCA